MRPRPPHAHQHATHCALCRAPAVNAGTRSRRLCAGRWRAPSASATTQVRAPLAHRARTGAAHTGSCCVRALGLLSACARVLVCANAPAAELNRRAKLCALALSHLGVRCGGGGARAARGHAALAACQARGAPCCSDAPGPCPFRLPFRPAAGHHTHPPARSTATRARARARAASGTLSEPLPGTPRATSSAGALWCVCVCASAVCLSASAAASMRAGLGPGPQMGCSVRNRRDHARALRFLGARTPSVRTHTPRKTHPRRYGIMGIGAVCHTLNPRLSERDIAYIAGGWLRARVRVCICVCICVCTCVSVCVVVVVCGGGAERMCLSAHISLSPPLQVCLQLPLRADHRTTPGRTARARHASLLPHSTATQATARTGSSCATTRCCQSSCASRRSCRCCRRSLC
jgi:hypothetical protein